MDSFLKALGMFVVSIALIVLRFMVLQHAFNVFAPHYGLPMIGFSQTYLLVFMTVSFAGIGWDTPKAEKETDKETVRYAKVGHSLGASLMTLALTHFLHWLMF